MDNFFKGCPAMMSDGRLFTDYRTSIRTNEYIKYINGIERDDDYRLFLQSNAEQIMDNQWNEIKRTKTCNVNGCVHNYPTQMPSSLFIEEKKAVNDLYNNSSKYVCQKFDDYRTTNTKNC